MDTIVVTADREIEDVAISVDITHAFIGDLQVDVTSPAGTTVDLHNGEGESNVNINLTWTDAGIPNALPYTCGCDMQPSGVALSTLAGPQSVGTWTLSMDDTFPSADSGELVSWCVKIVAGDPLFRRGDVDGNGLILLNDAMIVLAYLHVTGALVPQCLDAADLDDDGAVNLSDAVALLNYLFMPGATIPAAPGPELCGSDPTLTDTLADCVSQNSCP